MPVMNNDGQAVYVVELTLRGAGYISAHRSSAAAAAKLAAFAAEAGIQVDDFDPLLGSPTLDGDARVADYAVYELPVTD